MKTLKTKLHLYDLLWICCTSCCGLVVGVVDFFVWICCVFVVDFLWISCRLVGGCV